MSYPFKHANHYDLTKVEHDELISEKSDITLSGKCMYPADSTDGALLAEKLGLPKEDFFYKYHSAGPEAYKKASLATKEKGGSREDIVGHLEYYKKEGGQKYTHVGTAYIKQSDVSTPIRKMSEGETIQAIPISVEPGLDGKMSVKELKEGFNKANGECRMVTDVPDGILMTDHKGAGGEVISIKKGTPYQWVHPGGWVYKMGEDFYYTGLTKEGWDNTDKSLKDSISAINKISGGGRKRRRKTKRKRTKRRKTKRKRSRRKRTMKRKKRRGKKRRGKTRRRR